MQQGTWWIMWPLFGVGVVIWNLGLDRRTHLAHIEKARRTFLSIIAAENRSTGSTGDRNYDDLLKSLSHENGREPGRREKLYRQFLLSAVPELEAGFSTMTAWIYVAPLLGLLGTVIGMIQTFRNIMLFGTNNPAIMADGISVALLTTQAGLIVAFPALVLQVLLANRKNRLTAQLISDGKRFVDGEKSSV